MKHIKTENHLHKGKRSQIITVQTGTKPMPLFGQWIFNDKGDRVPRTWDMPIKKRIVIHHAR